MLCLMLAYPARLCVLARRQGRSAQYVALAISCAVLWFFMAMRAQTVGVDTKYYVCIYQQFPQISWKELFTAQLYPTPRRTWELDLEPGYRLLNKLLSIYLPAPQWITVANSALIIALLYRWLRHGLFFFFFPFFFWAEVAAVSGLFALCMEMCRSCLGSMGTASFGIIAAGAKPACACTDTRPHSAVTQMGIKP